MMLALKVKRGHEPRNARNTALEGGKVKETGSPPEPPEGVWPCQHLDFGSVKLRFLTSRTVRESMCIILSSHRNQVNYEKHPWSTSQMRFFILSLI